MCPRGTFREVTSENFRRDEMSAEVSTCFFVSKKVSLSENLRLSIRNIVVIRLQAMSEMFASHVKYVKSRTL